MNVDLGLGPSSAPLNAVLKITHSVITYSASVEDLDKLLKLARALHIGQQRLENDNWVLKGEFIWLWKVNCHLLISEVPTHNLLGSYASNVPADRHICTSPVDI